MSPARYFLTALALIALSATASFGVARLGPINTNGGAGASLEIPVAFTSSENIACLQFDVLYDPARVTLGTARTGTAATDHRIESAAISAGHDRVVIYSTTLAPLNGGYIVQVPVTWTTAGDSGLDVSSVKLADTAGTAVAFTSSDLTPALTSTAPGSGATGGASVALNVEPTTGAGVTYEWTHNGEVIPGATSASINLASVQRFNAGTYQVTVSANGLTLDSQSFDLAVNPPAPNNARLLNLSTRAQALTGDNILIPGFVVSGSATKRLLIRAVGPTLSHPPFNVNGTLDNPRMALKRLDFSVSPPAYVDVDANDDWQTNPNAADVAQAIDDLFAFDFQDDREAALLVDLAPGQYTVFADGVNGATGVAIVELYDADSGSPATKLVNISNRGFVGTGDNVMIPGFVVSSEGPKTLLIRVVGPTLAGAPFNVPGTMADPKLEIFRAGEGTPILTQDNWGDNPDAAYTAQTASNVGAFGLAAGNADAAFVVTLEPGTYTVVGSSADGVSTGVVLVEVYVVP